MPISYLEKRIEELILSGLYTVVDLSYFKNLDQIKFDDQNSEYASETLALYKTYLQLIDELPEKLKSAFLSTLKRNEIKNTQELEDENSFLLDIYQSMHRLNSINMAIDMMNRKGELNSGDIKDLHRKILQGTSEESEDTYNFRKQNDITVSGLEAGKTDIHFIPIDKKDIPEAFNLILKYMNDQRSDHEILLKPFVVHALIAILQGFPDGNTRLARLISYIKIWDLSKKNQLTAINTPALYMSKNFLLMKASYRENLRKIVVDHDSKAWNSWFRLNLNAMNEQLFYSTNNLEQIKKRM